MDAPDRQDFDERLSGVFDASCVFMQIFIACNMAGLPDMLSPK